MSGRQLLSATAKLLQREGKTASIEMTRNPSLNLEGLEAVNTSTFQLLVSRNDMEFFGARRKR